MWEPGASVSIMETHEGYLQDTGQEKYQDIAVKLFTHMLTHV